MSERWRSWDEIEAEEKATGRITEEEIRAGVDHLRAVQRAYRLAEIRKAHGLTQTDLAREMHVSQRRVSAVEHGELSRTELSTVSSYVEALGGRVKIVADFGDEQLTLA